MVEQSRFIDKISRDFSYVAKSDEDLFSFIEKLGKPRKTGSYNANLFMLNYLLDLYKSEPEIVDRVRFSLVQYWLDSWENKNALTIIENHLEAITRFAGKKQIDAVVKFLDRQSSTEKEVSLSTFPRATIRFSDLHESIRQFVVGNLKTENVIQANTQVFTKGSCFAENIVRVLSTALTQPPVMVKESEEVTTFDLAQSLANHAAGHADRSTDFWDHLQTATHPVFIYTLGVSEGFFDSTGAYVHNAVFKSALSKTKDYRFRSFTIDENASNLERAFRHIRKLNDGVRIVVTLSPVPLEASFRPASSVFVSDCINKSIGRATIDVVMTRNIEGVYYFPSYEMVRWMAPYYARSPFGADDGHPRHVNNDLVKLICVSFLEYFAARDVYEQAAAVIGPIDGLI